MLSKRYFDHARRVDLEDMPSSATTCDDSERGTERQLVPGPGLPGELRMIRYKKAGGISDHR
jgi:hypothetical protein